MASIIMSSCGLKPTEAPVDGSKVDGDAFSLTGTVVTNDGGLLKKPNMPTYACADQNVAPIIQQPVPTLMSRMGPLEVHLRSSNWGKSMDENLFAAGQSAASGAGFRILGLNGGQSPVSAPWTGLDQIIITAGTKTAFSPFTNLFSSMLGLKGQVQKIKADGSVEFNMPLRFDSKTLPIRTPTGTSYAARALLEKPLSPGAYRIFMTTGNRPVTIDIDVRPGDVNNSFSVDFIDQDFFTRNQDKSVKSTVSLSHGLGLIKADINGDGLLDILDMSEFLAANPNGIAISSDFAGDALAQSTDDISTIRIGARQWSPFFHKALGTDAGFTLAPASCVRSLPWFGMNQIIVGSNTQKPLSGNIKLSNVTGGKEVVIITSDLAVLSRVGQLTVLNLSQPLKSGIYQLKISVNNVSQSLDGVATRLIRFRILEGDIDGNYIVDRMDIDTLRKYFNQMVKTENVRADLNGNGFINTSEVMMISSRLGQFLTDSSIPTPKVTEVNKTHIVDENGNFMPGVISASIDGQVVGKVELNGQDAGLVEVTGSLGSNVLWSNSLTGDTFVTVLDGKGDYGQGHYVVFKAKSVPVVPPKPPKIDDQLTWIDVTTAPNQFTLKDNATGLWWSNYRSALPWEEAQSHCETLNYNGKANGWRLPNVEELKTAYANGIKSQAREGWITNFQGFWSSSPFSDRAFSFLVAGWDDNNPPNFIYTNDYDKRLNVKFVCVLDPTAPPEKGGCGRYFGETAGSFPGTKDECFMKQEEIDNACKKFSGQGYKVNWTRFNADSTVKEVLNLQNGVCQKLPATPPTYVDNPDSGEPTTNPAPAAKVGVGFETGSDMDFNDVYACIPSGEFTVKGREIMSAIDQAVPIYFGNIATESNLIIVKAFMSGQLIVERNISLAPRQWSAGKTVLDLPKGATVTFQLKNGLLQTDLKRTVIDINTCRIGS